MPPVRACGAPLATIRGRDDATGCRDGADDFHVTPRCARRGRGARSWGGMPRHPRRGRRRDQDFVSLCVPTFRFERSSARQIWPNATTTRSERRVRHLHQPGERC
ncbi:hypothetical protein B4N89_00660 [Embleya scabrispora]|uniref:Uncharacterized protein n=1 Tax=Embleya scabrispora TaxID=159449 RepID=A0A1T3NSQ2_9ACTN|nr:hypothetical protein B4N89_00660 [Embleya scabrispora]